MGQLLRHTIGKQKLNTKAATNTTTTTTTFLSVDKTGKTFLPPFLPNRQKDFFQLSLLWTKLSAVCCLLLMLMQSNFYLLTASHKF